MDQTKILELLRKYQSSGGDKLLEDIFESVAKEKLAGRLSNGQILSFVKTVSPMLSADQRQKLNGLAEQLTKI